MLYIIFFGWVSYLIYTLECPPCPLLKLSCLHTTAASLSSQSSLQMVPQLFPEQISTRPRPIAPLTRRTSPFVQPVATEYNISVTVCFYCGWFLHVLLVMHGYGKRCDMLWSVTAFCLNTTKTPHKHQFYAICFMLFSY